MKQLGDILQKQVQQMRERMQMKKILNHYLSGGTLVSPEGHTLKKDKSPTTQQIMARIDHNGGRMQLCFDPVEALAAFDWEIQREPGVYRVARKQGSDVYLKSWDGSEWRHPINGNSVVTPGIIIERVEAEPTPKAQTDVQPEAQNAIDRQRSSMANILGGSVLERLKQMAGGFVPDWGDEDGGKYFISYNCNEKVWSTTWQFSQRVPGVVYFRTQKEAQAAIDELGEELLG